MSADNKNPPPATVKPGIITKTTGLVAKHSGLSTAAIVVLVVALAWSVLRGRRVPARTAGAAHARADDETEKLIQAINGPAKKSAERPPPQDST